MTIWVRQVFGHELYADYDLSFHPVEGKSSLKINIILFPAPRTPVKTLALIDSGAAGFGFIDRQFAKRHNLQTSPLPKRRQLLLADGKPSDTLSDYIVIPQRAGDHVEWAFFYICNLSTKDPVILGLPWLQRHNPDIDWPSHTVVFDSPYCLHQCCLENKPVTLTARHRPTIRDTGYRSPTVEDAPEETTESPHLPKNSPHVLELSEMGTRRPKHHSPTVADSPDEGEPQRENPQVHATELEIHRTLTPGAQSYRTRQSSSARDEARGRMIPNARTTKQSAARKIGKARLATRPPQKNAMPPLSVPVPSIPKEQPQKETPDLRDIKMTRATTFLQFCKTEGAEVMRVTWNELDALKDDYRTGETLLPDLPENQYRSILEGDYVPAEVRSIFPERFHDFLDDFTSPVRLNKLTDSDIDKFMKGKPELNEAEIQGKLPAWLQDLAHAFLPRLANELPPRRIWDHKIDIMPGREPPYNKNRPLSPAELQVVRKWLDDNLSKGFIRESRSRCAAPLLLAAKPGGGVRICQDYRGLNNVTIKNRYPLPLIRETLDALCRAKIYTKLDIIAAFNKLRIAEGHEWKTAFITRFGLFE